MVTESAANNAVDAEAIRKVTVMTERLKRRKKEWEEARPLVSAQTSVSFTRSWKQTEGLHLDLRWAKAFQNVMREAAVVIREGELIVGSTTRYVKGVDMIAASDPFEFSRQLEANRLQRQSSDTSSAEAEEKELQLLQEDVQYWLERIDHLPPEYEYDALREELGQGFLDMIQGGGVDPALDEGALVWDEAIVKRGVRLPRSEGDITLRLLRSGLSGCIARARAEQEKMARFGCQLAAPSGAAYNKHILLRSAIISCEAVVDFARRHAELARRLARTESDPVRKKELEKIAEVCDWVPANPPRDFWEAVQFASFMCLARAKEDISGGHSVGRLDQYLYPWYEKDLSEGRITRQEAAELIGCFWMKRREVDPTQALGWKDFPALGAIFAHTTIGGRDEKGRDETNELSWLILEVVRQTGFSEPSVYLRYHPGMSKEFMRHAMECARDFGGGSPAFLNDEMGTARFLDRGVTPEDATNWGASACLGIHVLGTDSHASAHRSYNHAKILEITLHNGLDPRTGKQLGLRSGEAATFTSIEQVYEAYFKQLDYFAELDQKAEFIRRGIWERVTPNSGLAIAMFKDCIARGLGPMRGGERNGVLSIGWVGDRGVTDLADSLTAIKYLVFDKKQTTMARLMDALRSDWQGHEDLRQACLKAPKYGNDDDYADDIFNYVSLKTQEIILRRPDPFTGLKRFLFKGAGSGHVVHGRVVGALPNGRKAGTSINDAFSSAMPGMDVKGPTALINSATKVDHTWNCIGATHNMKFDKSLLNTPEKLDKAWALMETFFARGGWHIQTNIVNADDLLAARKHPEKWRHLTIRVGGFSAYFVDLPLKVQDEIITRTLHGL